MVRMVRTRRRGTTPPPPPPPKTQPAPQPAPQRRPAGAPSAPASQSGGTIEKQIFPNLRYIQYYPYEIYNYHNAGSSSTDGCLQFYMFEMSNASTEYGYVSGPDKLTCQSNFSHKKWAELKSRALKMPKTKFVMTVGIPYDKIPEATRQEFAKSVELEGVAWVRKDAPVVPTKPQKVTKTTRTLKIVTPQGIKETNKIIKKVEKPDGTAEFVATDLETGDKEVVKLDPPKVEKEVEKNVEAIKEQAEAEVQQAREEEQTAYETIPDNILPDIDVTIPELKPVEPIQPDITPLPPGPPDVTPIEKPDFLTWLKGVIQSVKEAIGIGDDVEMVRYELGTPTEVSDYDEDAFKRGATYADYLFYYPTDEVIGNEHDYLEKRTQAAYRRFEAMEPAVHGHKRIVKPAEDVSRHDIGNSDPSTWDQRYWAGINGKNSTKKRR